jgi:hypothetical protein
MSHPVRRSVRAALASFAVLAVTASLVLVGAQTAQAASQSALITISPSSQSQPTGAAQTYNIAISCEGEGDSECGPNTTVSIPLDTSTTPSMTDPTWLYSATSGSAGLITSPPTVVGTTLVFSIDDSTFVSGYSGTIRLQITPPNHITPNNTSWSVLPTISGDNVTDATAADAAASIATAKPLPAVTKKTADGGSVYEVGSTVNYTIAATCSTASTGNLYMTAGSLVDQLPVGMTYSGSDNGGIYDSSADTVTWPFTDPTSIPAGCGAGSSGSNSYTVSVVSPASAPATQPLVNHATFAGTGPDATNPAGVGGTTTAQVPVNIVDTAPTGPGTGYATISKTSLAPIPQPGVSGNQYVATYPGDWLTTSSAPSYTVGAAPGSFQTTVSYGLVGSYETDLVDPLPCLSNSSGNVYSSPGYQAAACTSPAFHTTIIQISSAGTGGNTNNLGVALASGWLPTATLTDGSTVILSATSSVGVGTTSAYFKIPTADLGQVASIDVPPSPLLENKSLALTIWGYADPSLAGVNGSLNELDNVATATPYLVPGTPLAAVHDDADLFTIPQSTELGISKSFGTLGAGPGGTTILNIVGSVNFAQAPLAQPVVLTDLLPLGLTWANPSSSATFALSEGSGAATSTATAVVEDIQNYEGSGRELIRATIPATAFTSAGSWKITPSTNLFEMVTPSRLGVYANTDQIFLKGLAPQQISATCSSPTQTGGGTSTATFESDNALDLAADGNLSEDYCQNSASLDIFGTGAAFSLTKTVQGNLDPTAKGALGVGDASDGGTGKYVLAWTNVGSDSLNDEVIYDVLPYVGDGGVSGGQSGILRGSEFAPLFTGIGALPAGVSVEYSQSENPCRSEVFASNPTCVDDWSPTAPADLSTVKALRFFATNTYLAGNGFSVSISIALPAGVINQIAWNSAATNASDVSDPSAIPQPAEPPKVGIVASNTPTLTSQTSLPTSNPNVDLSDAVTISGTGGQPGTVDWSLVGPVAPVAGSCAAASWSGAPSYATGTTAAAGDGTVMTGPVTPTAAGCYSWTDSLSSTTTGAFPSPVTAAAGAANEVSLVSLYQPAIVTDSTATNATGATNFADTVTVSDSGVGLNPGSPATTALTWTLVGPVPAIHGKCTTVSWAGAPQQATGTMPVAGDNTYTTPETKISAAGCYTFFESLAATTDGATAATLPGDPAETVQLARDGEPILASTGTDIASIVWTGFGLLLIGLGLFTARTLRSRRFGPRHTPSAQP